MSKRKEKRPHSMIAPELVDIRKIYTFSLNPGTQPTGKQLKQLQQDQWHNGYFRQLQSLKASKVQVVWELSRLGRWHLHGLIQITDRAKFFVWDIRTLMSMGTFEIDEIDNEDAWTSYVYKQEEFIKPYLEKENIPYTLNNMTEDMDQMKTVYWEEVDRVD